VKRNVGPGGHRGGTLAEKLQQRGQKKGRWWSPDTRFPLRKGGYDVEQVDRWLERIDNLREKGFAPARYTPPDGFISWWATPSYDPEAVDPFLAGLPAKAKAAGLCVLPAPPLGTIYFGSALQRKGDAGWRQFESDRTADWQRISDVPGVRLIRRSRKVTSTTGEVLLTRRKRMITLASGPELRLDRMPLPGRDADIQLSDGMTGEPVLWLRGCHFASEAGGQVLFPGRRYLTFPVSGSRPKNTVMTAVSESGSTMLWFRATRLAVEEEVIVSPDLSAAEREPVPGRGGQRNLGNLMMQLADGHQPAGAAGRRTG